MIGGLGEKTLLKALLCRGKEGHLTLWRIVVTRSELSLVELIAPPGG